MENRTIGQLISGFGAKLLVAGVAVWFGLELVGYIGQLFGGITL